MDADLLPVLVHIQANLDTDLSADALATRTGLSESTLRRRILEATGETPRQHIERLRLERAAAQLQLRQSTVLDIALDNGFASHEVFTRAFGRHFGVTPREWRERETAGGLGENGRQLGLTPPEQCRFDAAWTIDAPLPPECGLGEQTVDGGSYALTTYVGPLTAISEVYALIGQRLMRHPDLVRFGASIEWYRTGSIDEINYLSQIDITFPITARADGPRVLE